LKCWTNPEIYMIWEVVTWYPFVVAGDLKTNLFAMGLIRGILNTMQLHLPCHQKNNPDYKNNPDHIKKMQYTLRVLQFSF